MPEIIQRILAGLGDELHIERQVNLSDYSTYLIGGPADYMAFPGKTEHISRLIKISRENNLPYLVLGNGSNLLFHDHGFRGLVINTAGALTGLERLGHNRIMAEAGVHLHELSVFALYNNLSGLEFCEGIPGTVGGALYMNAGAYGSTIGEHLESSLVIDESGQEIVLQREQLEFGQRCSRLQREKLIVLSAVFSLDHPGSTDYQGFKIIFEEMRRCIRLRRYFQPSLDDMKSPLLKNQPSAGSVFGSIKGLPEGEDSAPKHWICRAGLKGLEFRGARVSSRHPNFIINTGSASAADVRALISRVKAEVEAFVLRELGVNVQMEPEIICLDELGRRMEDG